MSKYIKKRKLSTDEEISYIQAVGKRTMQEMYDDKPIISENDVLNLRISLALDEIKD